MDDISLPTGKERILVIDDEQVIVNMEEEMLGRLGYRVISRTSSTEAFQVFLQDPAGFDLVITDMNMPLINGDVLARKILELRSDIPIIMCSGSLMSIDEQKAKSIGIREFIMKPLKMRTLAETVRKVLNRV